MIDTANFPLDEQPKISRPAWAAKTPAMPGFISRRITGAIIRFQPSLGVLAVTLCIASGAGLVILALLSRTGRI
jgi:hypothetical protein